MRRAWELAVLPFALAWMLILLALVMLHVIEPDPIVRNIRQPHWPPAEPQPDTCSAPEDSRRPVTARAPHPRPFL